MATKLKFTQAKIREIPFSDTQVDFQDTENPHLFLRVGKKTKTFFYLRRVEGVLKKKALSGMTLEEAKKEVSALDGDVARSKSILTPTERDITLQEAFEYYTQIKGFKYDISNRLKHVSTYMSKPLKELTKAVLKERYDKLCGKGKIATANCLLRYISAIVNLCIKDELYLGNNPVFGIKKIPMDARKVVLDKLEIIQFLEVLDELRTNKNETALDALKLLVYTGQRKGNVLSMTWREIDFKSEIWTIPAIKFKGRRTQEVVLSKHAIEVLKSRLRETRNEYVFPAVGLMNKTPYLKELRYTFNHVKKFLGVQDLRIHDLRRSYGSLLLNEGVPIEVISKVLGHSSTAVTERVYAHVNRQSLQKAKDVFDSVLGNC